MIDTSSFDAIKKNDEEYRLQVVKDHTKIVLEIEELIRYQYELHEELAIHLNDKFLKCDPNNISPVDKRITISHALYTQNFKEIHSAYELVLSGKISTSYSHVRKAHESILAQYYVGLCDEDKFTEYVKLSEVDSTKLGYNFYKQELYVDDVLKNMSSVYSDLSHLTHPNWDTMLIGFQYDKKLISDVLLHLRQSSLFNVLSYCQVYVFDKKFTSELLKKVQLFVDEQLQNSNYKTYKMFPNHPKLIERVLWHPSRQHNNK